MPKPTFDISNIRLTRIRTNRRDIVRYQSWKLPHTKIEDHFFVIMTNTFTMITLSFKEKAPLFLKKKKKKDGARVREEGAIMVPERGFRR